MPRGSARKKSKKPVNKRIEKKMQKVRKVAVVTILFMVAATFLSGYFIYKRLNSELASAFSPSSYNILDHEIFTVAYLEVDNFQDEPLKTKRVEMLVFDKSTQKLVKYNIPLNLEIDVPGRFGVEPFSNILAIGKMDNSELCVGAKVAVDSLFKLMAYPVDRYVLVEERTAPLIDGVLNGELQAKAIESELFLIKDSIKTNMSLRELFDAYSFAMSLPRDRVITKEYSISYSENPLLLDEEFMDITFDTELSREEKSISILNASDSSGVATLGARVVKNLSGRIVSVGNASSTREKGVIITDDLTSETTRTLMNVFNIEEVLLDSDAGEFNESEISRSDVTVILGIDFTISM